jgi:hypothetical protein
MSAIDLSDYEISEEHFENVALEFYGTVKFPAGSYQVAEVVFPFGIKAGASSGELRSSFMRAMESYRRP